MDKEVVNDLVTLVCFVIWAFDSVCNKATESQLKPMKDKFSREISIIDNIMNNINNEQDSKLKFKKLPIGLGITLKLMKENEEFKCTFNELFNRILKIDKEVFIKGISKKNYDLISKCTNEIGIYDVMVNVMMNEVG